MPVVVTPSTPTESSTAAPGPGGFSSWFKNIGDWLKSLSPAGATQYDTGWQTTGLTFTAGTDWTVNSYRIRRIGREVYVYVIAAYGGADVSTAADGSLDNLAVATLPETYRPSDISWPVHANEWSHRIWAGYVNPAGTLVLSHGPVSRTITAGNAFSFHGNYITE